MKTRFLLNISLLAALPITASSACLPIAGDRILGRDLALVDARFAPLPASLIIGYAPVPGAQRIFAAAELARIARAHGITLNDPSEVCFEIPMRQLMAEDALKEMRRSLPAADLAIVELPKTLVPAGAVEFPLTGLEPASVAQPGVQLWHGYLRYAETRRMPVWARVSVSQTLTAVVAGKDLAANVPIDPRSLRIEERSGPLVSGAFATRMEDVLGHIPTRSLKAGAFIPLSVLSRVPDIHRGDAVEVQVLCGRARLQLSAIAERDGHNGELVELRNPASGKTFRARLDGPKAVMLVGAGSGL